MHAAKNIARKLRNWQWDLVLSSMTPSQSCYQLSCVICSVIKHQIWFLIIPQGQLKFGKLMRIFFRNLLDHWSYNLSSALIQSFFLWADPSPLKDKGLVSVLIWKWVTVRTLLFPLCLTAWYKPESLTAGFPWLEMPVNLKVSIDLFQNMFWFCWNFLCSNMLYM